MTLVRYRICPDCQSHRPLDEANCENVVEGRTCGWPMWAAPVVTEGPEPQPVAPVDPLPGEPSPDPAPPEPAPPEPRPPDPAPPEPVLPDPGTGTAPVCTNGHTVAPGDLICPQCGADIVSPPAPPPEPEPVTVIENWRLGRRLASSSATRERFVATHGETGREGVVTLYAAGAEPDAAVHALLARLPRDHVPELIATGRWEGRAFEVTEFIAGGTFADLAIAPGDDALLRAVLEEIGRALHAFAEAGLRHRDLRPGAVLLRGREPLDLVITGFGSARQSDFDLDYAAPLEVTRYTAPEAIAGGVAAASDWWSLGMMLLEKLTAGAIFAGVNEQAFLIHVVAGGVPLPDDLEPRLALLLRGLLARSRERRWQWNEVRAWLAGEEVAAPAEAGSDAEAATVAAIRLGDKVYQRLSAFALAAGEPGNWEEARDRLIRGEVAIWAEEAGVDARAQTGIRQVAMLEDVSDDLRLSLALKAMHPAMPLVMRGAIVNFRWLLDNPEEGHALVTGPGPDLLRRLDAEPWLTGLKTRAETVRRRARDFDIAVDEERLRVLLLAPSRAQLAARWELQRALFPDTEHAGLVALIERRQSSDEDLILLLAAEVGQFRPADDIIAEAAEAAAEAGIAGFDPESARARLALSRRDLHRELDARIAGFARCDNPRADEWADRYRLERRLPLARVLALLALAAEAWKEPASQTYVATLLDFFARKVAGAVQRGPLTRFTIGKGSARVDLTELGSERRPATALLDHLLARSDREVEVDPAAFDGPETLERRLRRLEANASLYRRDTGIDGLYLGFPFLLMRDPRGSARTRIAPVLLWPVKLRSETGRRGHVALAFDRDREEVRLNPAFEGLMGPAAAARWLEDARDLLGRSSLTAAEVMDGLGMRATVRARTLAALPGGDATASPGDGDLVCAAALFHLAYMGQSIAQDLAFLKAVPPEGTALQMALRLGQAAPGQVTAPAVRIAEADRYGTSDSDPSQDKAMLAARAAPGLLVEGPPGTGKSQTIVNMVADAIGHGRTLLIVCQKQAALDVVHKRLVAEGLGERIAMVTDINRDRRDLITAVREQVVALHGGEADARVMQQRAQLAARIEALESDLDRHHAALHQVDSETGLSYRALLGELIEVDAGLPPAVSVPSLRPRLAGLDPASMAMLEETLAPLARHWLPARYERSPLAALEPFAPDEAGLQALYHALRGFAAAEASRNRVNQQTRNAFAAEDPGRSRAWLGINVGTFQAIAPETRANLAAWLPHFRAADGRESLAVATGGALDLAVRALAALDETAWDAGLNRTLVNTPDGSLAELVGLADAVTASVALWRRLMPPHLLRRRRLARLLVALGIDPDPIRWPVVLRAARLEQAFRPLRQRVIDLVSILHPGIEIAASVTPSRLGSIAAQCLAALREVEVLVRLVHEAPCAGDLEAVLRDVRFDRLEDLVLRVDDACTRFEARHHSRTALAALEPWFTEDWMAARGQTIARDLPNTEALAEIWDARSTMTAYQNFRLRASRLGAESFAILAELRRAEEALDRLPPEALDAEVRRILAREARLAWKARLEAAQPTLLTGAREIATRVKALEQADLEMRALNRRLLIEGIDRGRIAGGFAWNAVTNVAGPNALRLRPFFSRARELGLMVLRPVWLMNPDVASQMLEPQAGLFDTVIYDEASQMPVEHALPTLFRARVAVVSGDEKQMPPTAFFSSRIENDEAGILEDEELEEDASEEERDAFVENWNRREIKDCPDLLHLARAVLPSITLDIHYRSVYRELIGYSNAAFYGNRLNVPARHPVEEIRRVRPIEVVRADGVYGDQVNPAEAAEVVRRLAEFWREPEPPSVGVVTFNRKQAEVIEEALEQRAGEDEAFRDALSRERERSEDGEDMGFFVKNVENVQGDERDVIVFSSTFGRNAQGQFRRHFGVLGQTGGERRLNVAVTRARRKIVMVTSMPIAQVSDFLTTRRRPTIPRDYLQAYLDYARALSAGEFENAEALLARLAPADPRQLRGQANGGDGFSRAVDGFLRGLGHEPVPVIDGSAFALDFAIRDPRTGLFGIGIECDAPRHAILTAARAREIWRPKVIARAIRSVHRVSSHGWVHAGEEERRRLAEAVAHALGREEDGA